MTVSITYQSLAYILITMALPGYSIGRQPDDDFLNTTIGMDVSFIVFISRFIAVALALPITTANPPPSRPNGDPPRKPETIRSHHSAR